jgi:hypothetical protein
MPINHDYAQFLTSFHSEKFQSLTLQRHFRALTKFAHVALRLSGHKRQRGAVFYAPVNLCDRRPCSASVAVGLSITESRAVYLYRTGADAHSAGFVVVSHKTNNKQDLHGVRCSISTWPVSQNPRFLSLPCV